MHSVVEEELHLEGVLKALNYFLAELSSLEENPLLLRNVSWAFQMLEKIQSCKSGLRFLRMFAWSISTLDDTDAETRHILIPENRILILMSFHWGICEGINGTESWILDLHSVMQNCKKRFQQLKVELLFGYSLRCNPLNNSSTVEFLDAILQNLKDLFKFKTGDEIILLKNQIATLEGKVTLLHNFFNLTPVQWMVFEEMRAFIVSVHVFAQNSASLVFLYWVKAIDEEMATKLNILLVNVLQIYGPCVPAFKALYIRFLEELKSGHLDSFLSGQIVHVFLDLLLENLSVHISKEDFQIIQESLFFVISFLANPPDDQHVEDEELKMLTAEMDLLVKEDLYRVLSVDDINADFSEANACLGDFTRMAELVKGKIKLVYERIQVSFSYDFPKINGLGFFDLLLQNLSLLKEKLKRDTKFIPFAKHLIIQIEEELMSLRPYLGDLFERQKELKELKETWLKVIDLAYQTEYAINSCSVAGDPLWYNMARLMEVLDKLKDVNSNLKKIEGRKAHDGEILHCSAAAPDRVPECPSASVFNEVMVGLEEEADKIVENLINGSKSLEIVAIVGMPGLGKTTMANKVYNAPAVRNHFHVFAYCIVSQDNSTRRILHDILGDIGDKDEMKGDLDHMLHKRLSGRRYLIIMDDIWDVATWDEVQRSLIGVYLSMIFITISW